MLQISNPKSEIRKIGVIGEGKMGTGIFNYLLDFPFELVWVCNTGTDTIKIVRQFDKKIKRSYDSGIIDFATYENRLKTVISTDPDTLHDCDLIIEAIPENAELKKNLFVHLDKIVKPEAIFTSNSSSFNPSEIAPPGQRLGQFAGLHFFYPLPFKNIVEFMTTKHTTAGTLATLELFLNKINRRFISLDEKNSFMLNKIFLDVQNEAFLTVQSGQCSYRQMDLLVKKHLFPFGIFDFCDSVGIDTLLASIQNYTRDYPDMDRYTLLISGLGKLLSAGKYGVKSKEGFYTYPMEEMNEGEPENAEKIVEHLRLTWFSSAKRFSSQAKIPMDDANHAIREYFDVARGPLD
jgi:3-hydroxyacyl-CoA dehydrogenase